MKTFSESNELTSIELAAPSIPDEQKCVVIARLTTSYWSDSNGLHSRRTLRYLRKQSRNRNFVQEDASMVGADETWHRITNIDECKDGIYEVVTCNESRDWEIGIIDDYDFQLVPYTQPQPKGDELKG